MSTVTQQWDVITNLLHNGIARLVPGSGIYIESDRDEFANLPLILAFSLLDEILNDMKDNGIFHSCSSQLGAKMHASKTILPWIDFDFIDQGRKDRNELAHGGILISRTMCKKYIDAIGEELKTWGGL